MTKRREIPYSPVFETPFSDEHDDANAPLDVQIERSGTAYRPETELQALMEAAPNCEPEWSKERLQPIGDLVAHAIEALPQRDRWIVNATVIERKPVREIAKDLSISKTHVDRLKHAALARLALALEDHELVKEFLSR